MPLKKRELFPHFFSRLNLETSSMIFADSFSDKQFKTNDKWINRTHTSTENDWCRKGMKSEVTQFLG